MFDTNCFIIPQVNIFTFFLYLLRYVSEHDKCKIYVDILFIVVGILLEVIVTRCWLRVRNGSMFCLLSNIQIISYNRNLIYKSRAIQAYIFHKVMSNFEYMKTWININILKQEKDILPGLSIYHEITYFKFVHKFLV